MPASRLKDLAVLHEERRRAVRDDVDYITVATRNGRERISVRLVDISPMGFHARTPIAFERGEKISLVLPVVGEVQCQLAWALKGCFGGWFERKIPAGLYPRMLAELAVTKPKD